MKWIFCVFLSLFLVNFNVDSHALDVAANLEKPNEEMRTHLNADCIILILERVKFTDLLNVAQVNEEFWSFAASAFRRKYSNFQIVLRYDFRLPDDPSELLTVADMQIDSGAIEQANKGLQHNKPSKNTESENQIKFESGEQILNTFKYFGQIMKKLKSVQCILTRPLQVKLIGNLISKYSSESLVDIAFENSGETVLEYITKPLINVENVAFKECGLKFTMDTLRPNQLFPALRRLNSHFMSDYEFHYFNYHMPHLEHVSIDGIGRDGSDYSYPGLIMKNPQIRSIEMYNARPEFIQKLNDFLPQLDTLKLSRFKLTNGNIQFENVTTFITDCGFFTTPANLRFPRLQAAHIDYSGHHIDDYLQFFNEHNHLSHLHLRIYESEINDSQFEQLTAILPDLAEMELEHANKNEQNQILSTQIVMEFLRSHQKVNQISFKKFPKHCEAELQEQLKDEWNMRTNSDGWTFERKINTWV